MESRRSRWVVALASLVLVPVGATADGVEEQLRQMQERLTQLEDRLEATADQLEAANARTAEQQKLLQEAGIVDGRAGASSLASFLDTLEIGGWVSGSYWHNFNDPDRDDLRNANIGRGTSNPLNPDADSFSFDQLWFELERPIDEGHRAGFRTDILFGKTAELRSTGINGGTRTNASGDFQDLYIHQAYVQYLAPIGNGITFKAGKFATPIGYEVMQAPYNYNISRGLVWNLLQPIDHVGLMMAGDLEGGFDWALALVNSLLASVDADVNDGKTLLAHLGYARDGMSLALAAAWGSESVNDDNTKTGALDLIATWDPSEQLAMWLNGTFLLVDPDGGNDFHAWGVSVGGRLAVTERTGAAVRLEYVEDDGPVFAPVGSGIDGIGDSNLYSITGTLDHKLTDQLLVRGEVRWDRGNVTGRPDHLFVDDGSSIQSFGGFRQDDQTVVGAEVVYTFN